MIILSAEVGKVLKHKFSAFNAFWNCNERFVESVRSSTDAFRWLLLSGNSFKSCATFFVFTSSLVGNDQILNSKRLPFSSSSCHKLFDKKMPTRSKKKKIWHKLASSLFKISWKTYNQHSKSETYFFIAFLLCAPMPSFCCSCSHKAVKLIIRKKQQKFNFLSIVSIFRY